MAGADASPGVVNQKVWVLRVSIHCEGCKKKIQKMLSRVHGVSSVVIDAPEKRVTVTGDVDGDTLVQRLAKSNKHAVLLPHGKPAPGSNSDAAADQPENGTKPKETREVAPEEKPSKTDKSGDSGSVPEPAPAKTKGKKEKKSDKKPQSNDKKTAPEGKTEEKQAPKNDEGAAATSRPRDVADMYPYVVQQPQPAYAVSYNVAQPSFSHAYYAPPMPTASQGHAYYAPPVPTASQGHAYYAPPVPAAPQGYGYYPQYASPPPEFYYGPADGGSSWSSSQQPTHTYDSLFSEENPNGCVVM